MGQGTRPFTSAHARFGLFTLYHQLREENKPSRVQQIASRFTHMNEVKIVEKRFDKKASR